MMALPPGSMLVASGILKVDRTDEQQGPSYRFDYAKLESFFQSINKQLFEAKCGLQECVTEKMYRDEIFNRLELTRKVDGSLVDINMIKDIMFQETFNSGSQSANNSAILPSQKVSNNTTTDVKVLRGEIENIKMTLRRMDLYHAEGIEVFSRLKRQEQSHRKLEDDFNEYRNSDLFAGIRSELQHLKDDVIKQLHDENKLLENKIIHLEARMQQVESNLKGNIGSKLTTLEERLDKLEEKTYEIEKEVMGEENDMAEGSDESNSDEEEEEKKGIVHQIFRSSSNSPSRHGSVSQSPTKDTNPDAAISELPDGLKHRYSIAALPAEQRTRLLSNYALNLQKQQSSSSLSKAGRRKGSKRFGGGGGFNMEQLEGKYVDVETFQKFVAEAQSIREDLLKFRLKMQCFECKAVTNVFNKYMIQKTQDCTKKAFQKWLSNINRTKEVEEDRKKRILTTFLDKIFHANTHHQANEMFHRWKYITEQLGVRDRIRRWVQQIAKQWLERVKPNLSIYMDRWKKHTIMAYRHSLWKSYEDNGGNVHLIDSSLDPYLSRSGSDDQNDSPQRKHHHNHLHRRRHGDENVDILPLAIQMTSSGVSTTYGGSGNGSDPSSNGNIAYSLDKLKQYAFDDLQIQWKLQARNAKQSEQQMELQANVQRQLDSFRQQNAIDDAVRNERVYSKLSKMETTFQGMKNDLKKALAFIEEEKEKIKDQTDQQLVQFTQQMNVFKNQVMLKFTTVKEEVQVDVDRVLSNIRLHQDSVSELREQIQSLTDKNKELQEVTIQNVLDRQQELNTQFQDIEKYMLVYRNKIDGLSEEVLSITDRVRDTLTIAQQDSQKAHEFQSFYDEELNWMKTIVKETSKKVTEVKTSYEVFVKESHDRFEAILNADADDIGFRADGSITDRFKDLLLNVKKQFTTFSVWLDFFYASVGNSNPQNVNMLELFQFPQMMKNVMNKDKEASTSLKDNNQLTTAIAASENLKKWEELKLSLSEELTKIARRIAHIIAVKGDQQMISYQITSDMLHITPATVAGDGNGNGAGLDNYPLLHMDRTSSIQIVDPLGQIHYCEKSSQNIRQHYLQMIHTLLHHYLSTTSSGNNNNNNATSNPTGPSTNTTRPSTAGNVTKNSINANNTGGNSLETVKRREKFIDQFVKLVDACLTIHPLLQPGGSNSACLRIGGGTGGGGTFDAGQCLVQGNGLGGGGFVPEDVPKRRSNNSRRPSSAHAAIVSRTNSVSRTSMNQAALHNLLAQSMSVQQLQSVRSVSNAGYPSPPLSNNTGSNSAQPFLHQQQLLQQTDRGTLLNLNSASNDFSIDGTFRTVQPNSQRGIPLMGELMMSKVNEEPTFFSNATVGELSQEVSASHLIRQPSFPSSSSGRNSPVLGTPIMRASSSGHQSLQSDVIGGLRMVSPNLAANSGESRADESFAGYLQRYKEEDRIFEDSILNVSNSRDEGEFAAIANNPKSKMMMKNQPQEQQVLSQTDAGKMELHITLSPSQRDRKKVRAQNGKMGGVTATPSRTNTNTSLNTPLATPSLQIGYPSAELPSLMDATGLGSFENLGMVFSDPNAAANLQNSSLLFGATTSQANLNNPSYTPEKFIASTIDKMQSIGDNYHHFSEKTNSLESSPSKASVIAHSAIPQQILVDSIVSNYPKDISIRAKHQEAPYENLKSNEIGLVSRRLKGNHE